MIEPEQTKGKLVVIDGTDGCGKGTQVELLVTRLRALAVPTETIDFPRYSDNLYGQLIGRYLKGEFGGIDGVDPYYASLPYALDRLLAKPLLEQWLNEGKIVIANRYVSANMGHQTARLAPERREDYLKWLKELEYETHGIPREDLVIFLYANAEVGQSKVGEKNRRDYLEGQVRDIYEGCIEHLKTASDIFLQLACREDRWILIDCMRRGVLKPKEEIHDCIIKSLTDRGIVDV